MIDWLRRNRFALIVTGLYFLANLILVLNHEPWTDEVNPYLIAKHIDFSNFFEIIKGEPHPILWTLILAPFAKLGVPLIASHFISLVIMTIAVWLLMKYAPFPKIVKVLVALSAAFFYFNPVISRDYCLIPLAAVTVCLAYKDRFRHPLRYSFCIAFLLQTHFLALGLAAVLYIVFFAECIMKKIDWRRIAGSVAVVGGSVVLCFVCAIGSLQGQVIIQDTMRCCGERESEVVVADYLPAIDVSVFGMAAPVIEVSLILTLFYVFLRYRRQFWYLLIAVLVNFIVLSFVYGMQGNVQKDAINLIFILVVFWTIYCDTPKDVCKKLQKKIKSMVTVQLLRRKAPVSVFVLTLPFAMSVPNTLMAATYDLTQPFSGSMAIAEYINENLPADSVIVVSSYGGLSTLTPLALELTDGRTMWDALNEEAFSYIDYTLPTRVESYVVPIDKVEEVVKENFESWDNVYYLNNDGAPDGWQLIEDFPRVSNKYFRADIPELNLYKVN
jgi:hypothetical protein